MVRRLRLAEPQEFGVAELRREGSVQLPQEPSVLRGRQVATCDAGRVGLAQRVAEEAGIRTRRDQQRTIRLVRHAFERKGTEDRLDAIEVPILEQPPEERHVGLPVSRIQEFGDLHGPNPLEAHSLHVTEVRKRDEAARQAQSRRGLRIAHGHREVMPESTQVVEGGPNREMRGGLHSMVQCDPA